MQFVDLLDGVASHIFVVAKRLFRAVRDADNPDAVTLISDDDIHGKGFNEVEHYKLHIIPRYVGDGVKIDWGRKDDPGIDVRSTYARQIRRLLGD